MSHQIEVFNFLKDKPNGAMFLDPGLGKTFISIRLMKHNNHSKILVFGPSAVGRNWELEIKKFWPDCKLPIHVSYGGDSTRKKKLEAFCKLDKGILIVNYEIMSSKLKELIFEFNAEELHCDESHLIKSHKSKRAKDILKLRKTAKACYLLTGTPVLQTVTDLFMQFHIMDLGETFGTNFFVFQRKYMIDKNAGWSSSPTHFPDWQVNQKMMPELEAKIKAKAIYMEKGKVLDLPELIEKNYYVGLTKEQTRVYKDLSKRLVSEITEDTTLTVENALTKILRLNQICAGHISEDNVIIKNFEDAEKYKLTLELVQKALARKEKIIVWCAFKQDVVNLTKTLNEFRDHICYITGAENAKQKAKSMDDFENDPNTKICIANLSAGGTGINLIAASESINFSRNYKLGDYLQSEARNNRKGSEIHESLTQHNIIVRGSIEEKIVEALLKKRAIGQALFKDAHKMKEADKAFKQDLLSGFMRGI